VLQPIAFRSLNVWRAFAADSYKYRLIITDDCSQMIPRAIQKWLDATGPTLFHPHEKTSASAQRSMMLFDAHGRIRLHHFGRRRLSHRKARRSGSTHERMPAHVGVVYSDAGNGVDGKRFQRVYRGAQRIERMPEATSFHLSEKNFTRDDLADTPQCYDTVAIDEELCYEDFDMWLASLRIITLHFPYYLPGIESFLIRYPHRAPQCQVSR